MRQTYDVQFEVEQSRAIISALNDVADFICALPQCDISLRRAYRIGLNWLVCALSYRHDVNSHYVLDNLNYDQGERFAFRHFKYLTRSAHFCEYRSLFLSLLKKARREIEQVRVSSSTPIVSLVRTDTRVILSCAYTSESISADTYERMRSRLCMKESDARRCILSVLVRYRIFGPYYESLNTSADFSYTGSLHNSLELFGSPMNAHCNAYCSLFPDLERPFGCVGSAMTIRANRIRTYSRLIINPPHISQIICDLINLLRYLHLRGALPQTIVSLPVYYNGLNETEYNRLIEIATNKRLCKQTYTNPITGDLLEDECGTLTLTIN